MESSPSRPNASAICNLCGATFSRHEHLVRHRHGSHTREKPFRCPVCGKSFARQDVMRRHVDTHDTDTGEGAATTRPRACRQCAACRIRCSRTDPCARCSSRGLVCVYPEGTTSARHDPVVDSKTDSAVAGLEGRPSNPSILPAGISEQPPQFVGFGADDQVVDMLAMNWISPEDSYQLDWNDMLATETLMQLDANRPPFSFSFGAQIPAPEGNAPPEPADIRSQQYQVGAHGSYVSQDRPNSPALYRPYATTGGGSVSGSTPTDGATSYVDGGDARAPFPAAAKSLNERDVNTLPHGLLPAGFALVTHAAYDNMTQHIQRELQHRISSIGPAGLPSHQRMVELASLYFAHFHPVFPFIRRADLVRDSANHWILLLAVAAIGTKYAKTDAASCSDAVLVEILDMASSARIHGLQEPDDGQTWSITLDEPDQGHDLPLLQALTLNTLLKLHSGNKTLGKRALLERAHLVFECRGMHLLSAPMDETSQQGREAAVSAWLINETRLRTGMVIWLLDFMTAYEYNVLPLMQLVDAKGQLPCPDNIWEAPTAEQISSVTSSSVSFLDAVEMLYIEKRRPESLTDFGSILLIHAILRRTKEAVTQAQTQLCSWTPTATAQQRTGQLRRDAETWPPATPALSRWRNSACDGFDILHWRANAAAAAAAGWEHPAILYLHLARLIILAPTAHLHTLATFAGASHPVANSKYDQARAIVLRWAIHDSFKARLSAIHAGAIFWHIRRFSSHSFIEPFAVYISTLVLWAYSISAQSLTSQASRPGQRPRDAPGPSGTDDNTITNLYGTNGTPLPAAQGVASSAADEDDAPDLLFIQIDRPCDDEMVQTYIRNGASAHMARIGNILDQAAPTKILKEGLRLISAAPALGSASVTRGQAQGTNTANGAGADAAAVRAQWGIERSFAGILEPLIQVMGGQSRQY